MDEFMRAAIDEARRRTRANLPLPERESFRVEYVTDKSWSGYNWFKGKGHSLIQVNTDLPSYIDRAIDLACHEGYPGHHVYNVLLEHHLAGERGWVEFTVYPLFSPQSLISEGSANYGREVAFSREERIAYERDVLFPLAGLDPTRVEAYYDVEKIVTPTRILGGEEDWNVPIQNSEQLYLALKRLGRETQLIVYPGEFHGIRVPSYQRDRFERYLDWYGRHLTPEKQ